jgi:hypothetical protein
VWLFAIKILDAPALNSVMGFSPSSNLLNAFNIATSAVTLNTVVSLAFYSVRFYSDTDKSRAGTAPRRHWEPIGYGEAPTCELKS